MIFAHKVNGSGWNRGMIGRKFRDQVDKGDYDQKDRDAILENLFSLAKRASK